MMKMSWAGGSKDPIVSKGAFKKLQHLIKFFYDLLKMHAPDCTNTQVSEFLKEKIIQHARRRANSTGARESGPKFRGPNSDGDEKPKKITKKMKKREKKKTNEATSDDSSGPGDANTIIPVLPEQITAHSDSDEVTITDKKNQMMPTSSILANFSQQLEDVSSVQDKIASSQIKNATTLQPVSVQQAMTSTTDLVTNNDSQPIVETITDNVESAIESTNAAELMTVQHVIYEEIVYTDANFEKESAESRDGKSDSDAKSDGHEVIADESSGDESSGDESSGDESDGGLSDSKEVSVSSLIYRYHHFFLIIL